MVAGLERVQRLEYDSPQVETLHFPIILLHKPLGSSLAAVNADPQNNVHESVLLVDRQVRTGGPAALHPPNSHLEVCNDTPLTLLCDHYSSFFCVITIPHSSV
jgi:hypothetical protein